MLEAAKTTGDTMIAVNFIGTGAGLVPHGQPRVIFCLGLLALTCTCAQWPGACDTQTIYHPSPCRFSSFSRWRISRGVSGCDGSSSATASLLELATNRQGLVLKRSYSRACARTERRAVLEAVKAGPCEQDAEAAQTTSMRARSCLISDFMPVPIGPMPFRERQT